MKEERVTPETYFNNSLIKELLKFYHDNFYLYRKDQFGDCYMHSLLPVDDNGEVSIGHIDGNGMFKERDSSGNREKGVVYKKKRYQNKAILNWLNKVAKDIRTYDIDSNNLSDVMEAFTLLTAIYADNTTRIKPSNLKEIKAKFNGFFSILHKMGISTLVVGHNPISKLGSRFESEKLKLFNRELDRQKITILNADGEMSSGYQKPFGAGLGIEISLFGVRYRGFLTGDSETFSGDYTPDVSPENTKFTIILNIFPGLKKVLLLSEKVYDIFIKQVFSFNKTKDYFKGNLITKSNSTLITIATEDQIKEYVEKASLNGISTIAIVPNRLNIFSQEEEIEKAAVITIKDVKIPFNVYLNKIVTGNGKTMKCLSYEYQKSTEISDKEIEAAINLYICEKIVNKQYRKYDIKTSKNLISDININNGFVQTKKTTSDKLQKALVKSFGMLPILYDLNLQQITDIEELTTNINVDKIKDILSAA